MTVSIEVRPRTPNPPLHSDPACIAFRSLSASRFPGFVQRLDAGGSGELHSLGSLLIQTLTLSAILTLLSFQGSGDLATKATIGPGQISVPSGLIMLVKKGDQYGALRFSDIKPDQEKGWGSARYESAFQGNGSGAFSGSTLSIRKGKVHAKSLVGIGRMSFQVGPTTLRIGPFKFYYRFPNWVYMWPAGELEGDYGFEFSLVRAQDFSTINVHNPNLHWYRFDRNSSVEIDIP